jgi:hypothetical protein
MVKSNADVCRERDWTPGTVIEFEDEWSAARFRITGIGESLVLTKQIGCKNHGWDWDFEEFDHERVAGFRLEGARKVELMGTGEGRR